MTRPDPWGTPDVERDASAFLASLSGTAPLVPPRPYHPSAARFPCKAPGCPLPAHLPGWCWRHSRNIERRGHPWASRPRLFETMKEREEVRALLRSPGVAEHPATVAAAADVRLALLRIDPEKHPTASTAGLRLLETLSMADILSRPASRLLYAQRNPGTLAEDDPVEKRRIRFLHFEVGASLLYRTGLTDPNRVTQRIELGRAVYGAARPFIERVVEWFAQADAARSRAAAPIPHLTHAAATKDRSP